MTGGFGGVEERSEGSPPESGRAGVCGSRGRGWTEGLLKEPKRERLPRLDRPNTPQPPSHVPGVRPPHRHVSVPAVEAPLDEPDPLVRVAPSRPGAKGVGRRVEGGEGVGWVGSRVVGGDATSEVEEKKEEQ